MFEKYHYGLTAFSPLLGGYLTGKYLGDKNAEGRLGSDQTGVCDKKMAHNLWFSGVDFEKTDKSLA